MNLLIISESFMIKNALKMYFKNSDNIRSIACSPNISNLNIDILTKIDLVFVEINENNSLDDIVKIKNKINSIKIIVLDFNKDIANLTKSLNGKIEAYLSNLNDEDEFNLIVKKVLSGSRYFDTDLLLDFIENYDSNKVIKKALTRREIDILKLVGSGGTNKSIADALYISENTIKKHITSILNKLELKNRKQLILHYNDIKSQL